MRVIEKKEKSIKSVIRRHKGKFFHITIYKKKSNITSVAPLGESEAQRRTDNGPRDNRNKHFRNLFQNCEHGKDTSLRSCLHWRITRVQLKDHGNDQTICLSITCSISTF